MGLPKISSVIKHIWSVFQGGLFYASYNFARFGLTSHISMGTAGLTAIPSDNSSARSVHAPPWQRHRIVCSSIRVVVSICVCLTSQAWTPRQNGLQFPSAMCAVTGCVRTSNLPRSVGAWHSVSATLIFLVVMVNSSSSYEVVFAIISAFNGKYMCH